MSVKHFFAIFAIFLLGVAAWGVLGTASYVRTAETSYNLGRSVGDLWGGYIVQEPPVLTVKVPGARQVRTLAPTTNRLNVQLLLEQRRKGLLWYPTYTVDFLGEYAVTNTDAVAQNVRLHFPLPSAEATYDQLMFRIDSEARDIDIDPKEGINEIIELAPGQTRTFTVGYRTRGLGEWHYQLASDSGRVKGLDMTVTTNFIAVDFPEGSLSPMEKEQSVAGMTLRWRADDLITRQEVAVTMPEKLNPGPLSTRMSFFAPVCLLFFFVVIGSISILRGVRIHPMHYLFVTAGFFAFHLLFAYLVDLVNVHLAFAIASVVSVVLVTGYLAAALGRAFPWQAAALGQLFYLVLFSYSFFLKGMTGLTVTVGAVATLALLMKLTARLDWSQVFATKPKAQSV